MSPRPVRAGGEGPVLAATPGSDHDGDSFTESFMRKRAATSNSPKPETPRYLVALRSRSEVPAVVIANEKSVCARVTPTTTEEEGCVPTS